MTTEAAGTVPNRTRSSPSRISNIKWRFSNVRVALLPRSSQVTNRRPLHVPHECLRVLAAELRTAKPIHEVVFAARSYESASKVIHSAQRSGAILAYPPCSLSRAMLCQSCKGFQPSICFSLSQLMSPAHPERGVRKWVICG